MFDFFDDDNRVYEIIFSDSSKEELSEQSLFEYFLLHEHGLKCSFEDFKYKLDKGDEVTIDHCTYDWNLGTNIFIGKATVRKIINHKQVGGDLNCSHPKKYIVQHFSGGVRYWVCPDCKADLGEP